MFNRLLSIILLLLLSSQFCHAEETGSWELIKRDEESGIDIYLRVLQDGNIEFKGITSLKTSLNSIVALFNDKDAMHKWLYRTEKVTVLKKLSSKEDYVYSIVDMPFPFLKRDSVVYTTIIQDPESFSVTIRGKAKPDYLPEKKGLVRVREIESFWTFEPQNNGDVRIIFQGYGDPGGGFLSAIYRSPVFRGVFKYFLWKFPFTTLKQMKSVVYQDKYQTKKFPYIIEP